MSRMTHTPVVNPACGRAGTRTTRVGALEHTRAVPRGCRERLRRHLTHSYGDTITFSVKLKTIVRSV